jgi:long-chain acyl-CoA synthetase
VTTKTLASTFSSRLPEQFPNESPALSTALAAVTASLGERTVQRDVVLVSLPVDWAFAVAVAAIWSNNLVGTAVGVAATATEVANHGAVVRPAAALHRSSDTRFDDQLARADNFTIGGVDVTLSVAKEPVQAIPLTAGDAWLAGTSGSTGAPKVAILPETALLANAADVAEMQGLDPDCIACIFTPTHFTYALNQLVSSVISGASVHFWPHGLASPKDLRDFLVLAGITHISANPTSYRMLLQGKSQLVSNEMSSIVSGGQPLDVKLARHLRGAFPRAALHSAYGCTENVNRISYRTIGADAPLDFTVSDVGKSIPSTEMFLLASGEVALRGRSLMRGYLGEVSPEQRVETFRTGDLGRLTPGGDLVLVGRTKTAINVGNEMVNPEEVETFTASLPYVMDCAVGAVEDALLGEALHALIEIEEQADSDSVRERIQHDWHLHLSRSKRPTHIAFARSGTIPRTSYGKIDRRRLAEILRYPMGED